MAVVRGGYWRLVAVIEDQWVSKNLPSQLGLGKAMPWEVVWIHEWRSDGKTWLVDQAWWGDGKAWLVDKACWTSCGPR